MITGHVPAVRVPLDLAASRRAAAVPARGNLEGRRDLAPAPPAHRLAAASAVPPEADLGGPGPARDPAQRDTESASSAAVVARHSGHDPALAPRHRPPPMGWPVHARQGRPPGDPPEHKGTGPPAGPGESRMGLPQNPRRVGRPRSEGSGVNGMGDPEKRQDRPRTAADRANLVAVPALPGRRDPGVRLLHGRPARRHPCLRPGRDRARQQAHPHPGNHLASDWGMDRPAGPQPDHGP